MGVSHGQQRNTPPTKKQKNRTCSTATHSTRSNIAWAASCCSARPTRWNCNDWCCGRHQPAREEGTTKRERKPPTTQTRRCQCLSAPHRDAAHTMPTCSAFHLRKSRCCLMSSSWLSTPTHIQQRVSACTQSALSTQKKKSKTKIDSLDAAFKLQQVFTGSRDARSAQTRKPKQATPCERV